MSCAWVRVRRRGDGAVWEGAGAWVWRGPALGCGGRRECGTMERAGFKGLENNRLGSEVVLYLCV